MLDLATIVWGELIELYLEGTLQSLLQARNIPAAKGLLHSYHFYASDEAKARITASELYAELSENIEVNWFPLQKGEWETTSNYLHQMKASAGDGHHMLIMPPDTVVGNNSILNMAKLCEEGHNPILFGFPRVDDDGFQILRWLFKERKVISNSLLVSIAMRHIEQACYPIESKGNYWLVRHPTPTLCLVPDAEIFDLCVTNPSPYGGFDHVLPYALIEGKYPWYLIRDSEEFFWAERGRHLFTKSGPHWDIGKQRLGLEFFANQEEVWQGEEGEVQDISRISSRND